MSNSNKAAGGRKHTLNPVWPDIRLGKVLRIQRAPVSDCHTNLLVPVFSKYKSNRIAMQVGGSSCCSEDSATDQTSAHRYEALSVRVHGV